ncbi:DUF2726 domain-containing protein [Thermochromatium tepidum]|jgi:hypothetical protein|uniref:DUF2726 domain-containing protein n=1 Tax=Thermochromatium tepidum ATCC 43061 TaxID=316276 RepID=A0A6I6E418_THETI|nr:DUF2726 domain-containing protein [Thermochromatium tepidum]QGU33695.1 DUF2726 domain-containing protein [Thermochromatium tepidum ATCC 43061]
MGHFYVLIALGGLILLITVIEVARALGWRRPRPYVLRTPLLDVPELALLAVLEHILGPDYRLLVRVRAAEVFDIAPRLRRHEREQAAARLERYRFDVLICERETLTPRCALNLTPRRFWRKTPASDGLDRICRAAGLPLVRLIEQPHYAIAEVKARVREALSASARRIRSTPDPKTDLMKHRLFDDEPRFRIDPDLELDDL